MKEAEFITPKLTSKGKIVELGDTYFRFPFQATGFYVEDAARKTAAECGNQKIAKALADLLNKTYG